MRFVLLGFFIVSLAYEAKANNENWLTFVLKKNLSPNQYILSDYVRRDTGSIFGNRFRDLYRMAYGHQQEQIHLLLGGAVADFEHSHTEYRIFQQAIVNFRHSDSDTLGFIRIGLEERRFESDSHIYWRLRGKLLLAPYRSWTIGPVVYNETFLGISGKDRFHDGFNENRLGGGIRSSLGGVESSIIYVNTKLKSHRGSNTDAHWLQFQISYEF